MITFSAKTPGIRLAIGVTLANVLIAAGFSLAGLICPQAVIPSSDVPTDASKIFALYATARSLPLALLTVAGVLKRSWSAVAFFGLLAGVIQLSDAGIGVYEHDAGKTFGPLVIALVEFYAIYNLVTRHKDEAI